MNDPFGVLRRLFYARRKVKLWSLVLLLFSATVQAQTPALYAPLVIEKAALWLPDYLEILHPGQVESASPADLRKAELIRDLIQIARQFRQDNFQAEYRSRPGSPFAHVHIKKGPRIQFRSGKDPVFKLNDNRPARMAVTGTAIDSAVIFNLDLTGDPEQFGFSEAMALWIHELGHKLEAKKFTQEEIDMAAGWVARRFKNQMRIFEIDGLKFLILNPVPYVLEGQSMVGPFGGLPKRDSSTFAVGDGGTWTDLSDALDSELDRFAHPQSNTLEIKRAILNLSKLKNSDGELELHMELRTSRFPKNLNRYLVTEMGPNHFKSVRLKLSRDLKSLHATHYVNQPPPRTLILDAEAEIDQLSFSLDRKTLHARLQLHLRNETHFHAASYPEARFTLLALWNGEPLSLEAHVRYKIEPGNHGMPAEVHKKTLLKEGRLSIDLSHLRGGDLEIIGMVDRFFTLGRGWEPPEEEQKRLRLRESVSVMLPQNCAEDLEP